MNIFYGAIMHQNLRPVILTLGGEVAQLAGVFYFAAGMNTELALEEFSYRVFQQSAALGDDVAKGVAGLCVH